MLLYFFKSYKKNKEINKKYKKKVYGYNFLLYFILPPYFKEKWA